MAFEVKNKVDGQLQIVEGPDKGRAIPFVDGQVIRIGRGANVEVQLADPFASRMHCQIEFKGGSITLTDMGSSSGTVVNGAKIDGKIFVMSGDVIRVGSTKLQVQFNTLNDGRTVMFPDTQLLAASTSAAAPRVLPEDASLLEGATLGAYQLGKTLGTGATGIIYLATKKGDAQPVALKVFHVEFSRNPEAKQRFLRAASTMLDVRHPHLVSVLDVGETGVFCWMAMELVEGESLAKVIQRIGIAGILDWRYGLRVAVHVARGLEYAQQHSIVHRNIKPSNILMRTKDNFAKLGDLMLAKAIQGQRALEITNPGTMIGDIVYSSPERALGTKTVDGRSDLYELGATVYALLTGQPPFQGRSYKQVAQALESQEPAPPKKIQLSIPDAFNALVLRLLAKDPANRFQTPTELLAALEPIARSEKVTT